MAGPRSLDLAMSLLARLPRNCRKSVTFASLKVLRMIALCCGEMLACAAVENDDRLASIRLAAARCLSEKSISGGIPLQAVCGKSLIV
ncbi:hypothetical protein D3C81_1154790 [compost metagenome]